jgi:serine/threonine-protein kinase
MNVERAPAAPAFPARLEPGKMFGSYEVLLCVARGGMARVWAARQHGARGFTRLVALKTVLPDLDEPEFEAMFVDEARVAARIHHPNVCEIFELIEHEGVLALSMEWIDGDTLNAVIERPATERALDMRIAAQIVAQAAAGLHAAHSLLDDAGAPMQLVHRDVSPQNILISRGGHVKVADFGIAKALGGSREATAAGQIKGKLSYMSPEQADGKLLDRRSDIFSLGVVLYQTTVGVHPFRRANQAKHELLFRLLLEPITPPSRVVPGYPLELEAIVMRALARNPDERFATADELRNQLQNWLVRTGPLVTEHHIARLVAERIGASIEKRAARIQRAVQASQHLHDTGVGTGRVAKLGYPAFAPVAPAVLAQTDAAALDVGRDASEWAEPSETPETSQVQPSARLNPGALPEVTFVPTMSAAQHALGIGGLRLRARTLALAAGAAALGLVGAVSLTLPSAQREEPPVVAAAAMPAAVPALPMPASTSEGARVSPGERSAEVAARTNKPRAKQSAARPAAATSAPRPAGSPTRPAASAPRAPAASTPRPASTSTPRPASTSTARPPPYGAPLGASAEQQAKPAPTPAPSRSGAAGQPAPARKIGPLENEL